MNYATVTSIIELLPILPQTNTVDGYTATAALLSNHISRADAYINGFIARRYDISAFTGIPPLLQNISEDITSYYIMRSEFTADNQNDNTWIDKFKDALDILKEVKDGNIDLFYNDGSLIPEREKDSNTSFVESNTENYQSFFDEDKSLNWKVDSNKLDELKERR